MHDRDDLEQRVREFCSAPAGCASLLIMEQNNLTPAMVAAPPVAAIVGSLAMNGVRRWSGDHAEIVAYVLGEGARLAGTARELLARPETAWWFAPVREAQLWSGRQGAVFDRKRIATPDAPPNPWERYAQKTAGGLYTSTAVDDLSFNLIAIREGACDDPPEPPYTRYLLRADSTARVFEVTGSASWHALCTDFPALGEEEGRVVPDWSGVARDWDAVHLTLGGMLLAEQVRVEEGAAWTQHDGWDVEQTLWLRDCFTEVARLPDLPEVPDSDQAIHRFSYWGPDWDENPKSWRPRIAIDEEASSAGNGRG